MSEHETSGYRALKRIALAAGLKNVLILPLRIFKIFKFLILYLKYVKKTHVLEMPSPKVNNIFPALFDVDQKTVGFDRHYVYHTAWASRVLKKLAPALHVDISSSLSFVAVLSAFVPVKYLEYRKPLIDLPNLQLDSCNILNLPFPSDSVESLSCMHVVEHVGLGRYGDELDPLADIKAINELKRVLRKKGNLLFVVPIGQDATYFNSHRLYSHRKILELFKPLKCVEFTLIPDNDLNDKVGLVLDPSAELLDSQQYACGCFWFVK